MVLIVVRAWRITLIDSRRAETLRRLSPQTGLSGELLVLEGDGKARRGMRYPVIREGMIGTSRRTDVRIRHGSIRRKHAWFQLTEEGLRLRARPGADMFDGRGQAALNLTLRDGDTFTLGQIRLLLVLSQASFPAEPVPLQKADAIGDLPEDPDDLFLDRPTDHPRERRPRNAGGTRHAQQNR